MNRLEAVEKDAYKEKFQNILVDFIEAEPDPELQRRMIDQLKEKMSHYCAVCGRELVKTSGPIGPTCLKKIRPRNSRVRGMTKKQCEKMCVRYDMYDIHGGNDGPTEDDTSSENPEG